MRRSTIIDVAPCPWRSPGGACIGPLVQSTRSQSTGRSVCRKKAGSRMRRKAAWMQENAGLQLRGLTRRFGAVVAVDGVDLDIPAGQMLGVIGRSGAGKSTLLRMINRLQEPSAG